MEYYPNPFKPYLDAQFGQAVIDGHDLSIFAFGTWGDPGSSVIADFQLARRTRYLPAVLRHLPRFALPAVAGALTRGARTVRAGRQETGLLRQRVVSGVQAAVLPLVPPDLCMIHDLGTAVRLAAIRSVYPRARVALYYHGGEVARGVVRDEDAARAGLRLADTVFVNTAYSRDQILERGCPADRIRILPVGFDLGRFSFIGERRPADPSAVRLALVARLGHGKGVEHAIDAVGLLVAAGLRVECIVIGDGDERGALEHRARVAGLSEAIRFVGTKPHQEVIATLGTVDAVLLPSVPTGNWAETQGCVLQEAMLVGTMLIASRVGGVPESVPPEMDEFLVPPSDPRAIATAVRRLASMPPAERLARVQGNRAFCERRYDVRLLNRRMLAEAMGESGGERAA